MMTAPFDIYAAVQRLVGCRCVHANIGGFSKWTFSLHLVSNEHALTSDVPDAERGHQSSFALYVWTAWRLDNRNVPLTSSDCTDEEIELALTGLVGRRVSWIDLRYPGWDLEVVFDGELTLHVFSEYVGGSANSQGNFDVLLPGIALNFGPGNAVERTDR